MLQGLLKVDKEEQLPIKQKKSRLSLVHAHNRHQRPDVPPIQASPTTDAECREIITFLGAASNLSEMKNIWGFICEDADRRQRLKEIKDGCLYVNSDEYMRFFDETVEQPDPLHFIDMIEDSFFAFGAGGTCPHEGALPATSVGGDSVTPCNGEDGFADSTGECIKVTSLGTTPTINLKVYALDGLIGLDHDWETRMRDAHHAHEVGGESSLLDTHEAEAESVGDVEGTDIRSARVIMDFVICNPSRYTRHRASYGQLQRQLTLLNQAYSGQYPCHSPTVDTGFRFAMGRISHVVDNQCKRPCTVRNKALERHVPRENGKIKVIICDTGNGPWGESDFAYEQGTRMLVLNPKVLPYGSRRDMNQGAVLMHELGHYLGLFHHWQHRCGGGDNVDDTPNMANPKYDCGWRQTGCGSWQDGSNFMGYAPPTCLCAFTQGQVNRMWQQTGRYTRDLLP